MRRLTRIGATIATAVALCGVAAGMLATPASAIPQPCDLDCPLPGPTPTLPSVTTIYGISPAAGWSGDSITVTGVRLSGATVTVNGIPATVTVRTTSSLTFTVPVIHSDVAGPVSIPVAITSSYGTATTSFTLSSELRVDQFTAFNQGADGNARATVDVDRSAGWVHEHLDLTNEQFWLSLSVNVSAVWLDSTGKVVGYTPPQNVTATGIAFNWPNSVGLASGDWTSVIGPDPGQGSWIHSGQLIIVRDHQAELASTLSNAFQLGQNIKTVVTALAPFMV